MVWDPWYLKWPCLDMPLEPKTVIQGLPQWFKIIKCYSLHYICLLKATLFL